ncbi:MAG: hypothetical protein K9G62_05010 [Alphaproteobacteria bacterium]|nr:hypothetical protein [Alphaproteobacteria bacterium]
MSHFNQTPRRRAEFITPPNLIKQKVGTGGLSEDILEKAQALLENHTVDFQPLARVYLNSLLQGLNGAKNAGQYEDQEKIIAAMLYPAMQLKANGGMFHYPLVTKIADLLIQFLEVLEKMDIESLEIVLAFYTTLDVVVMGQIKSEGGKQGQGLVTALNGACMRYFDKNPVHTRPFTVE